MNTPPEESAKTSPCEAPQKDSPIARALAFAVPAIAVLQSAAFAVPRPNAALTGTAANIPPEAAILDPPSLVAATTTIATIGAYHLMKARARKRPDEKDSADS